MAKGMESSYPSGWTEDLAIRSTEATSSLSEAHLRRALDAEATLVASQAERARLRRSLERVQGSLSEIDAALAASEERRRAAESEAAGLRQAVMRQEEKRRRNKKRSILGQLRRRAKHLVRSMKRGAGSHALADRRPRADANAVLPPTPAARLITVHQSLGRRFEALNALRTYPELRQGRRVSMITDSISPGLLYGGVGTGILLATLLANRLGAELRVITRHHEADPGQVGAILETFGVKLEHTLTCAISPAYQGPDVATSPEDLFLTTSWWTTCATMAAVDHKQIIYLLQEDERMFYSRGDERRLCAEVLGSTSIKFVINSELLYRHFTEGDEPLHNIAARGCWFEPAFPEAHYRDEIIKRQKRTKKNFLFYARPTALRNMYWRGLEVIARAIEDRVLSPDDWNFIFVGRDLEPVILPNDVVPQFRESLPWRDYAALIREVDLGLSLIDTPHPSYPPLDMAASGAVVVTNRCGVKSSLANYSKNIICSEPTVQDLVGALRDATHLVRNERLRAENYQQNMIVRDWPKTLEAPVAFCTQAFS